MDNKKLEVPQSNIGDVAHTGITVALAAVPFLGLGELFKATITPPIEKRRDEWMQTAGELIEEIGRRNNITPAELMADEEFITLLTDASRVASGTHLNEKKLALKNALINSASEDIAYDTASYYLRLVDRLVPVQMRILSYVRNLQILDVLPGQETNDAFFRGISYLFRDPYNMGRAVVLLPDLEAYVSDLEQMGLIRRPVSVPGRLFPFYTITLFGDGFCRFIE